MIELRELAVEWKNPEYDRRRKYGGAAIASLPAGSRIVVQTYDEDILPTIQSVTHESFHLTGREAVKLIENTVIVQPRTWHEARLLHGDTFGGAVTNSDVLEVLWQSGDPEMRAKVEAAFATVMSRPW